MTELNATPDEARREAAATWLVRLEGDDASEADWLAFETWIADPANKAAIDAIEAAIGEIEDHRDAFTTPNTSAEIVQLSARRPVRRMAFFGIAASAAAAAAAALIAVTLAPPAEQQFAYAAPAESTRTITLPDSSKVTLNRGASIQVRWSSAARRIELERGEAAFAVVHDPNNPFIVAAGAETIRDVGTEFNVLRERNALTVTVRSGSVDVSALGRAATLAAGEQARVADGRLALRRVSAEDALAWRQGRLIYRDARLEDVVNDLNRYSATPISVGDPAAADLRFSGVLVIDAPQAMTTRLQAFLPVRSDHNARGIVLRSR